MSTQRDLFPRAKRFAIPKLTHEQSFALAKLIVLDCHPLAESTFVIQPTLLRRLIAMGCVEVAALSPAIYRVTKIGQHARSIQVSA
jgi:hypothetical protein